MAVKITVTYKSELTPERRYRPKAELLVPGAGYVEIKTITSEDPKTDFESREKSEEFCWLLALLWRDKEMPEFDVEDSNGNYKKARDEPER
jgi:hypothetical protein